MLFKKTEELVLEIYGHNSWLPTYLVDVAADIFDVIEDIKVSEINKRKLEKSYKEESEEYDRESIYYKLSNFETYKIAYPLRFNEFLIDNPDAGEHFFIYQELKCGYSGGRFPFVDEKTKTRIKYSWYKKEEFLLERLNSLGYEYYILKYDENGCKIPYHFTMYGMRRKSDFTKANVEQPKLLDTIDFGDSNCTEKIIWLYLLGILDGLHDVYPFNVSINLLATVISGVIGERKETIQSYINPIFNKEVLQKNNPLRNSEKVDIVRQKLISLGFKPTK